MVGAAHQPVELGFELTNLAPQPVERRRPRRWRIFRLQPDGCALYVRLARAPDDRLWPFLARADAKIASESVTHPCDNSAQTVAAMARSAATVANNVSEILNSPKQALARDNLGLLALAGC